MCKLKICREKHREEKYKIFGALCCSTIVKYYIVLGNMNENCNFMLFESSFLLLKLIRANRIFYNILHCSKNIV